MLQSPVVRKDHQALAVAVQTARSIDVWHINKFRKRAALAAFSALIGKLRQDVEGLIKQDYSGHCGRLKPERINSYKEFSDLFEENLYTD